MAPGGAPKSVKDSWGENVVLGIAKNDLPRVQKAFIENPKADASETVRNWNKLFYGGYYVPSVNKTLVEGDTVLHMAVRADNAEVVRFLFTLYPKPSLVARNKAGKTAGDLAKSEAVKDLLTLNDFSC
mmetsp:Transcript_18923/g.22648  ORF Transcript_18923/g.22648 Transcript_18923/m.22648 type:complete len:128 (-) Transcript_18923:41-424(-)